jgi:hypothetical protein
MSESAENDEFDRSRSSPEFILGGASGGDGLARRGAEGREDGRKWFLAVAAGEAEAGTLESVGRGGGRGRELAARAGGAAEVVLNLQRALGLYVVQADVQVALETLVCEGRKRILGSAFNFFLPFASFKGADLCRFFSDNP